MGIQPIAAGNHPADTIDPLKAQVKEVTAALKTAENQGPGAPAAGAARRGRFDSYEKGLPEESFGYYSVEPAEEEGYRVSFRPYANPAEEPEGEDSAPGAPEKEPERTTANTDRVDREIRQLEQERDKLEQELAQAENREDAQAIQELKRRIAAADQELGVKDSDAYRKAHAVYTDG